MTAEAIAKALTDKPIVPFRVKKCVALCQRMGVQVSDVLVYLSSADVERWNDATLKG